LPDMPTGYKEIIEGRVQGQAARQPARVRTFGNDPACRGLHSGFLEKEPQRYPGPLATAQETVALLRRCTRSALRLSAAVAGAFNEMNPGDGRQPPQLLRGA